MEMRLAETVNEFLTSISPDRATARQIAQWIVQNKREACEAKMMRSQANVTPIDNWPALEQQLVAEIGASRKRILKKYDDLRVTDGRPRQYFCENEDADNDDTPEVLASVAPANDLEKTPVRQRLIEHDLYPILMAYLNTSEGIYSLRVDENRSSNRHGSRGNQWLHPDIVGMEAPSVRWEREVRDCFDQFGENGATLYSFEVKQKLSRSNVRESFFQAVSNSSWANMAYLVAAEVVDDGGTIDELRMLSSLHGVGFIQLNIDDPSESTISIPARRRNTADWDSINRLAKENGDFMRYIKNVRKFHQTGDIDSGLWFRPPDIDD